MEVGEYVRTQNGRIGRVIKIWVWKETSKRKNKTHCLIDWGGKASYISILKNFKHSKNLIDLIEVRRLRKWNISNRERKHFTLYRYKRNRQKWLSYTN